jgi:hypothetical protein
MKGESVAAIIIPMPAVLLVLSSLKALNDTKAKISEQYPVPNNHTRPNHYLVS